MPRGRRFSAPAPFLLRLPVLLRRPPSIKSGTTTTLNRPAFASLSFDILSTWFRSFCGCFTRPFQNLSHFFIINVEPPPPAYLSDLLDHEPSFLPFGKLCHQTLKSIAHHDRLWLGFREFFCDPIEVYVCLPDHSPAITPTFLGIIHHLISPSIPLIDSFHGCHPISRFRFKSATTCSHLHRHSSCHPRHHRITNPVMILSQRHRFGYHTPAHECVPVQQHRNNALFSRNFRPQFPSNETGAFPKSRDKGTAQ